MSNNTYRNNDREILWLIVGSAFAARAISIWIFRPEFIGWFNHSYYYWVQVKGILESSQLPYADLPLIFYLYGSVAGLLQLFGMELQPAIVNSARLIMSIAPALIAIPVYLVLRRIRYSQPLAGGQWILVAVSAFLPLTFAHMPELLQKNMLGLLLLISLMYASYALLQSRAMIWLIGAVVLFILIALTHLGTLAVALLFGASLSAAIAYTRVDKRHILATLLSVSVLSVIGIVLVYTLDADAFARINRYAMTSLPHSLVGGLFLPGSAIQKLMFLTGILLPLGLTVVLLKTYKQNSRSLPPSDRIFWLGNILLAYTLVLPVFDLDVLPRLVLFMPLPLLVVVAYHLQYHKAKRSNRLLLGLASLGAVIMLFGETMNLLRLYPDKEEIHQELLQLREQLELSENDFVLAQYGANPICNWFLGTKSGLITALNTDDWDSYERVFVLDTHEGQLATPDLTPVESDEILFLTESEKYTAMRQSIPTPSELEPLADGEHLTFYELHTIPDNWLFDSAGNWIGYVERSKIESPSSRLNETARETAN